MTFEFYGQDLKSLRFCPFGSKQQSCFKDKVQWKPRLQGHLQKQSYQKNLPITKYCSIPKSGESAMISHGGDQLRSTDTNILDNFTCRISLINGFVETKRFPQSISVALNWNFLTERARGYFRNFISLIYNAWYFTTTANFSFLPFYYLLQLDTNDLVFNVLGFIKEKEKIKAN